MTHSLITTISGLEIWGDPDLIEVTGSVTTTRFTANVKLKEHYFTSYGENQFTIKRDTRSDIQFDFIRTTSSYDTKIFKDDLLIGFNGYRLGLDSNTTKVEFMLNVDSIKNIPIDYMNVFLLDYINNLIKSGLIDIFFNDVKYEVLFNNEYNPDTGDYETTSNINLSQYEPITIKVINNQVGSIFDIENMVFTGSEYDQYTGDYNTYDYSVTTKEPDLIVYTVSNDVTEWDRNITTDFRTSINLNPKCLSNINIDFIARPTDPTEDYPFIKIYDIDETNIKDLNTELAAVNDELLTDGLEPITKYISSLYRIPYPIETDSEPVGVQIANKGFNTTANLVSEYVQKIRLGTIQVEHGVLQGIGYKNIEFKLFIPNFKPIELEPEHVMGRTIDIDLAIDLTTGKGTVNIKIDGIVQYIESENIGKEIPFKADNININIGSSVLETDFINPYLLITVLEPNNSINSDFIRQRKIDSILPFNYGFIKTEKPLIRSKATRLEQLEIQRLLRNGVFVNAY